MPTSKTPARQSKTKAPSKKEIEKAAKEEDKTRWENTRSGLRKNQSDIDCKPATRELGAEEVYVLGRAAAQPLCVGQSHLYWVAAFGTETARSQGRRNQNPCLAPELEPEGKLEDIEAWTVYTSYINPEDEYWLYPDLWERKTKTMSEAAARTNWQDLHGLLTSGECSYENLRAPRHAIYLNGRWYDARMFDDKRAFLATAKSVPDDDSTAEARKKHADAARKLEQDATRKVFQEDKDQNIDRSQFREQVFEPRRDKDLEDLRSEREVLVDAMNTPVDEIAAGGALATYIDVRQISEAFGENVENYRSLLSAKARKDLKTELAKFEKTRLKGVKYAHDLLTKWVEHVSQGLSSANIKKLQDQASGTSLNSLEEDAPTLVQNLRDEQEQENEAFAQQAAKDKKQAELAEKREKTLQDRAREATERKAAEKQARAKELEAEKRRKAQEAEETAAEKERAAEEKRAREAEEARMRAVEAEKHKKAAKRAQDKKDRAEKARKTKEAKDAEEARAQEEEERKRGAEESAKQRVVPGSDVAPMEGVEEKQPGRRAPRKHVKKTQDLVKQYKVKEPTAKKITSGDWAKLQKLLATKVALKNPGWTISQIENTEENWEAAFQTCEEKHREPTPTKDWDKLDANMAEGFERLGELLKASTKSKAAPFFIRVHPTGDTETALATLILFPFDYGPINEVYDYTVLEIQLICTNPMVRTKGLGALLMEEVIKFAHAQKKILFARVWFRRVNFYVDFGFGLPPGFPDDPEITFKRKKFTAQNARRMFVEMIEDDLRADFPEVPHTFSMHTIESLTPLQFVGAWRTKLLQSAGQNTTIAEQMTAIEKQPAQNRKLVFIPMEFGEPWESLVHAEEEEEE